MARCMECSHLSLTMPDGSPVKLDGMGLCREIKTEGVACSFVSLARELDCRHFGLAAASAVQGAKQALEDFEGRRARFGRVREHVAAMRVISGRENRVAYLEKVAADEGADMRRDLEQAYTADWKARKGKAA